MITPTLSAGTAPATLTITSVVQNLTDSQVFFSHGASQSPVGGGGTVEVETSPDNSTWTTRTATGSIPLTAGTGLSTVSFLATPLYFRARQNLRGVLSAWSNTVLFNSAVVTPPVAGPNSVIITGITFFSPNQYRVFFTVNNAAAPAGTGHRITARVRYGSGSPSNVGSYETVLGSQWISGNNELTLDIFNDFIVNPKFIVDAYNSAGGYDSDVVSSDVFPEDVPEPGPLTESHEYTTFSATPYSVPIPAWATNFDYILAGAGGGGEGSLVVISGGGTGAARRVGNSGQPGEVITGNSPVITGSIFVDLGGGGGRGGATSFTPTVGESSAIDMTGTGIVASATGGAAGTLGSSVGSGFNEGSASLDTPSNVTISGVGTFNANASAVPTWFNNESGTSGTSQNVCGGAGSGWSTPLISLESDGNYIFFGSNGGVGYCKITFKNF
jgi:hypothetical protein